MLLRARNAFIGAGVGVLLLVLTWLLAFHVGTEVRHFSDWLGQEVDVDFRFYEPDEVAALLEAAGFVLQARLERRAYPAEVDTRRAYLLAARPE